MGHVHDRSPVIIPRDMVDHWLDPGTKTLPIFSSSWTPCPTLPSPREKSATESTTSATMAPN
ncbi:SOS response-associated peptidase [Arthrobacter sp. ISL-5]|uniref:SOS response-associated peptidase n=1 Tax=Arthrobacter sp. ISL-5 TaxID=2819111 RepID=UPI002034AEA0|nr:SOS response-associated peptidase [Arthrobacter sp. ISL-5]